MDSTTATKRARQPRLPIETRRAQVLDAALALIVRQGYHAVSMEAVAREADLAKPVVYNAFPRLGPLLDALLDREEARALDDLTRSWPSDEQRRGADGDPQALLIAWMRNMVAAIAARPDTWRLTLIQPEDTPALVRDRVLAGRRLVVGQLRSLLESAPGGPALDTELAAEALLAVAEHCARLLLRDPGTYPTERLIAFAEQTTGALFPGGRTTAPSGRSRRGGRGRGDGAVSSGT